MRVVSTHQYSPYSIFRICRCYIVQSLTPVPFKCYSIFLYSIINLIRILLLHQKSTVVLGFSVTQKLRRTGGDMRKCLVYRTARHVCVEQKSYCRNHTYILTTYTQILNIFVTTKHQKFIQGPTGTNMQILKSTKQFTKNVKWDRQFATHEIRHTAPATSRSQNCFFDAKWKLLKHNQIGGT